MYLKSCWPVRDSSVCSLGTNYTKLATGTLYSLLLPQHQATAPTGHNNTVFQHVFLHRLYRMRKFTLPSVLKGAFLFSVVAITTAVCSSIRHFLTNEAVPNFRLYEKVYKGGPRSAERLCVDRLIVY